jgi:5-methyltetrahydrofolate--homocysteine methyltransferase
MKEDIFSKLHEAMLAYDEENVKKMVMKSIDERINPIETVEVLTKSISEIGDMFQNGEIWLPDLMLAAKCMEAGMLPLKKEILSKGLSLVSKGKIVIGTVYGDLHSIGKSMVATLLNANGFEIIDLDVNVDSKTFIAAIEKHKPDILAMSALLTTTAPEMEKVIASLNKAGIRNSIKIIVGGGPITQEFADNIGADGYEPTAVLAVSLVKKLLNKN